MRTQRENGHLHAKERGLHHRFLISYARPDQGNQLPWSVPIAVSLYVLEHLIVPCQLTGICSDRVFTFLSLTVHKSSICGHPWRYGHDTEHTHPRSSKRQSGCVRASHNSFTPASSMSLYPTCRLLRFGFSVRTEARSRQPSAVMKQFVTLQGNSKEATRQGDDVFV